MAVSGLFGRMFNFKECSPVAGFELIKFLRPLRPSAHEYNAVEKGVIANSSILGHLVVMAFCVYESLATPATDQ